MRKNLTVNTSPSNNSSSSNLDVPAGTSPTHSPSLFKSQMTRSESQSFLTISATNEGEIVSTNFNVQPFGATVAWVVYGLVIALAYWAIHFALVLYGKAFGDLQDTTRKVYTWTILNLLHSLITFVLFHWKKGSPYDYSMGYNDHSRLTLWEQLDDQKQFTPTRKFMFVVPCVLLLLTSYFVGDNMLLLFVNVVATVVVVLAKLPSFHKRRIFGINK
ncbi:predicted protein [Naegleria gruberi]|uniref:Predicted protein n=1 Tax=Naegleria gruberi TaxID=5762 RepID=D2W0H5_NAEGR|nr:uncharacterized protein NAEGRDRAFT_74861 [Naegleria gruberi]EFC37479.1 predicted protein [Naegleria gruberi]|eukprot:XP_002670223.1 predicted protein [Naegleria gruberi strain NEG-M]